MNGSPDDDLDRLLTGAASAPHGLEMRVARRLAVARRSGRLLLALIGYALALPALAVLALLTGRAAAHSGARDLILLAIEDRALVRAYPGEYLNALVQAVPWALVCALAVDLLVVIVLNRYLLHATDLRRPRNDAP